MNSLTKKKTERGKVFGKLKRGLALLMAVIMAVTTPLPGMSFPSQAADPLKDELLPQRGGGQTTAYKFKDFTDGLFDIEGISNPALIGADNPYRGDQDNSGGLSISTTYRYSGYTVLTRVGTDSTSSTEPSVPKTIAPMGSVSKGNGNGKVKKDYTNNLEYRVKIYPSEDSSMIIVEYAVHNTAAAVKTVQLVTNADIWLGGLYKGGVVPSKDPADASRLFITNHGISMINTATSQTYELITNDPSIGLTTPPTSR